MDPDKAVYSKPPPRPRKGWSPAPPDSPQPHDDFSSPEFRPSQETQDHDSKSETSDQEVPSPPMYERFREETSSPGEFDDVLKADFHKEKGEVEKELERLRAMCLKVSPKLGRKGSVGERGSAATEMLTSSDKESVDWAGLRKQLSNAGQPPLKDPPSLSSLSSCLSSVLCAYTRLNSSQLHLLTKFQCLADKHKALLASAEALHKRAAKYKSKARDTTVGALKECMEFEGEGKPLEVFKNFFRRDFRPHSETDTKTMALIILYENKLKKTMAEGKAGRGARRGESEERQQNSQELIARLIQEKTDLQRLISTSPGGSYEPLHHLLGTKDPDSTLEVVAKMQSVIKSLPRIESFVKQVCLAVMPDLENCPMENRISCMDNIIPTLHDWREKLAKLTSMHRSLCKVYRIAPDLESLDVTVFSTQVKALLEDANAVTKFGQLFEVVNRKDTKDVIEQVFMLVHHTNGFLKVSGRQEAKYLLRMEEAEVEDVLARTLKELEARFHDY